MVVIRQHGDHALFDIQQFLEDIDRYFNVDTWRIEIDQCAGENSRQVERESRGGRIYTDEEFRNLYAGIHQTIDGRFDVIVNNEVVARLTAVDSSLSAARQSLL